MGEAGRERERGRDGLLPAGRRGGDKEDERNRQREEESEDMGLK
jgi:hypothetical protein